MAPYDDFKHLLRERRYREAASLAEAQVFSGGENGLFWLNQQAIALLRLGRPAEAAAVAEAALVRDPASFYSLLLRSEAKMKQGAAAEALAGFREAANYPAALQRARKGILDALLALRRFDEALGALNEWNGATDPQETFPYRIKALGGLGRFDDAMAVCREWLALSADNRTALWLLCELECRVNGAETTLAKYEKLAKIPSLPPIYGELCAMLCRRTGNIDRAIGQYDRLAQRSGDPAIARQRAFALAKSGREAEALPLFEELLRTDPADRYCTNAYIAAARRLGRLETAWQFYHDLLSRFPDQKQLYGSIKKLGREIEAAAPPDNDETKKP